MSPLARQPAPDCGACHDTGYVSRATIPRLEVTAELLHQMALLFNLHANDARLNDRDHDAQIHAGLGAVLERVLTPVVSGGSCSCKRGQLVAELER